MRAGFETILADYPDPWNINAYAKFACLVGDRATTRKALGMIKGEPIKSAWKSTGQYEECKQLAANASP